MAETSRRASQLNLGCACQFLDRDKLCAELSREPALAELCPDLGNSRPHLFSASSVFVSPAQVARMASVIHAVEQLAALPAWQTAVGVPGRTGPRGGLLGFDFHLDDADVQLIEINTNPGGALLNVALARAQRACCAETESLLTSAGAWPQAEAAILDVFRQEWQQAGRTGEPVRIALVDSAPAEQYLYPEFLLYRHLFQQAGWQAVIADPAELVWRESGLWHAEGRVDFVYNRLTDFRLEEPAHAAIRQAHAADAIVLSPHPQAHALYANKRNLALMSDPAFLDSLPLPEEARQSLLCGVPRTELVVPARGEALWAARKGLFFKPLEGYGSRAAYRGDKLTLRVWDEILQGEYVAQRIAPPSERLVPQPGEAARLKLDIRAYAYAGEILLLAARLYSGQTTNFRTPGGGFAPVWVLTGS
ncbi:hypothetical protein Q9Q94_05860 [Uliginosibacterium sp. 31-16]|uniref:hypothetical protein n=1 Tax=Uliginosibacterium sp. 31-16 TaxID=3068315 RepID=UPI00273DBAAA|nr:hypothetical protein [Uliginosibacterium sp. 31-16]MDP5239046.1 hypothetical protein [Uliginosibacterium sp. 31-16]